MSVFTSSVQRKPFVTQITILSVFLGGMLALSLKTQDRIRGEQLPNMRASNFAGAYADLRENNTELTKKVADLQARLTQYQKAAADESSSNAKLLNADLQKANVLAGLVAVSGPGIVVTLRDSKKQPDKSQFPDMSQESYLEVIRGYIIHDEDIQLVINELKAAGAEAIAVNDQRIVATSSVRCVGPSVLVNNIVTNGSPVRVTAIGNADAMVSGMNMPGGVVSTYQVTDPDMISIEKKNSVTLPAYAGATPLRFVQPAPEGKAAQAQRQSEKSGDPTPNAGVKVSK